MQHLNLNWLRTFETVARQSGFTAASKELGLTQTAVSQQIKALETKLGHELFIRRARSLELTDIAKAYLPSVRNALEALNLSTSGLFGPDLKSTIVVRGSMAVILWIAPKLSTFQEQHPGIGVKLVTAIWPGASGGQNVDIDVVLAPDKFASRNLEKLSEEFIVPVCGHSTAQRLKTVAQLPAENPIHVLGFDDHWSRYLEAFNQSYDVGTARLMADTTVAACEMAAAELGVAVVVERFAKGAEEMGQRVKIAGEPVALNQSHFLSDAAPAGEAQTSIDAFKEWLHQIFADKED